MNKNTLEEKKVWVTPSLIVYGDMASLTQQDGKFKQPGSQDDFGVAGISDA